MAFDGIITKALVSDFQKSLIGARVNKVFQPSKTELILNLYNGENVMFDICIHPDYYRMCLTSLSKPNPTNALNFCMLLRKYLTSSKITNVQSVDLDRVVFIDFEGSNELKDTVNLRLVVELMGRRSNVVLLNKNGFIIDSLKHIITSDREILPAREYVLPLSSKQSFLDILNFDEFYSIISEKSYDDLSLYLSSIFTGFTPIFISNILEELNIENDSKDVNELEEIYEYIKNLINNFGTENISLKSLNNDYTIELTSQEKSLSNFLDSFYINKEQNDIFQASKSELSKSILVALKKSSKKLENINQKLKSCDDMNKYKLYGELLTSNLYRFHGNFADEKVELENYYDNNNLIEIKLDSSISYSKNAERFFKKYNKLKNTLSIVTVQKKETELELEYIESIIFSLSNATTLEDIEEIHKEFSENVLMKKYNYKSFQKMSSDKNLTNNLNKIVINNFDVYIGKNNKQNDYLTLHFADKSDLWFHAQGFHGAHVILKTNGKNPDEDTLFKCAQLAKQNCKASLERNISVDYTYIKFVKRHPNGKTGMVNYTNYKTIIVP
ncbi:MAG: NFACT family protein [Clostridia bacterium]|nr:NFACT family protein [Clostridia bacterium]